MPSNEGFTPIFDDVREAYGLNGAAVFGAVWRFCQMDREVCDASHETISSKAGVTDRTVRKYLKIFVSDGLLTDHTPSVKHKPHTYSLSNDCHSRSEMTSDLGRKQFPLGRKNTTTRSETVSVKDTNKDTSNISNNNKGTAHENDVLPDVVDEFDKPPRRQVDEVYGKALDRLEMWLGFPGVSVIRDFDEFWDEKIKAPGGETAYDWLDYAVSQAERCGAKHWGYIEKVLDSIIDSGSLAQHIGNWNQRNGKSNGYQQQAEAINPNRASLDADLAAFAERGKQRQREYLQSLRGAAA